MAEYDSRSLLLNAAFTSIILLAFTTVPFSIVVSNHSIANSSTVTRYGVLITSALSWPFLLYSSLLFPYYYLRFARPTPRFLYTTATSTQLLWIIIAFYCTIVASVFIAISEVFWIAAVVEVKGRRFISLAFAIVAVFVLGYIVWGLWKNVGEVRRIRKSAGMTEFGEGVSGEHDLSAFSEA